MYKARPRRKTQAAQVIADLQDLHAAVHLLADARARLGQARAAPNATRRAHAMRMVWICLAEAERRIAAITAPGLRRRTADLQRELDRVHLEATVTAVELSQRERGGDIVDLAAERARRAGGPDRRPPR